MEILKGLKKPLKRLNKVRFHDIHHQQLLRSDGIVTLQKKLYDDSRNLELQTKEANAKGTYQTLLKSSLALMHH